MSLLVHYTLKSADDHDHQVAAMKALVANIKAEGVPVNYACFATEEPVKFVGVLEFDGDDAFAAFQASQAFATYREIVGPTFANPPQTTKISPLASTRD